MLEHAYGEVKETSPGKGLRARAADGWTQSTVRTGLSRAACRGQGGPCVHSGGMLQRSGLRLAIASSMPRMSASGVGGQPRMTASTGITLDTAPQEA